MITISDLEKIELRVATILEVADVENSDKLYRLTLDLDGQQRQIVSGIKKFYLQDELIGKQIIIVANLEPREIMGFTSQGMLLAAGERENLALVTVDKKIDSGTRVG